MRSKSMVVLYGVVVAGVLSACSTVTRIDNKLTDSNPIAEKCEIKILKNTKPTRPYKIISKIESHIKRNMFLSFARLETAAYKELKAQACRKGGNAVIIDDYVESSASEMKHVHVWGTIIFYN